MKYIQTTAINIFLVLSLSLSSFSQNFVMQESVTKKTEKPLKGPNCKYFNHFYFTLSSSPTLMKDEAKVLPFYSLGLTLGHRHIFRINNNLSTGLNTDISNNRFRIKQVSDKNIHDSILHQKEIFILNNLNASWFLRINFDKRRGMYIGNFLDLGIYAGYNFTRKRFIQDVSDSGSKVKIWYKNPDYIENFQYGLMGRLGFNRYVVFAGYRLSDAFDPVKDFSQLPSWRIGLEIGFHK